MSNSVPNTLSHETLVRRAGTNLPPVRVKFAEEIYDGTLAHADNPIDAVEGIRDAIESEYEVITRNESYPGYTVPEIAVALNELLERMPYGKSIMINPYGRPPATRMIDVGYDAKGVMDTRIIHDAGNGTAMSLPGLTELGKKQPAYIMVQQDSSGTPVVAAAIRRRDQGIITGLFEYLRDWADENSIYVGQCIDTSYNFQDLTKFNMEHVALTNPIRVALHKYVLDPLTKMPLIKSLGQSSKTGILFYGEPGGGKTMTKTWAEAACVRSGGIVVRIPAGSGLDGFRRADVIASRLMRAGHMVMLTMEDVETLSTADRSKVLDILDGSGAKNANRIIIATTNRQDILEEAFKRPGRWNAVMHCGLPDVAAFRQVVTIMLTEERLAEDIDWERAFEAYEGYTYAFIGNSVDSIIRGAITRVTKAEDFELKVTTEDLVQAGEEQRPYFILLQGEQFTEPPALDETFRKMIYEQVDLVRAMETYDTHDVTNYGYIKASVADLISKVKVQLKDQYSEHDITGRLKLPE